MELYVLSKQDLSILSVSKLADYQINLDEETNAKSSFTLIKTDGLKKDNYIVLNGLYRQFLFVIEDVQTEKDSNVATITALDISNIFDRKIIEKNTDVMKNSSIEQFIANTISENFVNSDDTALNVGYIDIYWHTNTKASVSTNAENGLYNFHTFLINCRQYKNIYTNFKVENNRLRIDIENKEETTELIDTTVAEITNYNKTHEEDVTAKVQVYIREDGSEYNLYLKTDRTTTTNKDDPDRATGKIEVISVDTAERAAEEALNVMKGNNYKHLVEFKIAKTSKLMDVSKLHIGRPVRIKTLEDIYDSYISAITLTDENFVYFKSGSLRTTLLDKLKKKDESIGNKVDVSGGRITGDLNIDGTFKNNNKSILDLTYPVGSIYLSIKNTNPGTLFGGTWAAWGSGRVPVGVNTSDTNYNSVEKTGGAATHTHTQGATGASSGSTGGPSNNTSGSTAITVAQMPKHRHLVSSRSTIATGSTSSWRAVVSDDSSNADYSYNQYTNYQGSGSGHTHTLSSHTHSLNSHTHSNPTTAASSSLQPYITCYMWKRTA